MSPPCLLAAWETNTSLITQALYPPRPHWWSCVWQLQARRVGLPSDKPGLYKLNAAYRAQSTLADSQIQVALVEERSSQRGHMFNHDVCSTRAAVAGLKGRGSEYRQQKPCHPGWNGAREGWSVFGRASGSVVTLARCWLRLGSSDVSSAQLRPGSEAGCKTGGNMC